METGGAGHHDLSPIRESLPVTTRTWDDAILAADLLVLMLQKARESLLAAREQGAPPPLAVTVDYRPHLGAVAVGIHGRSTVRYIYTDGESILETSAYA